jgi:hypothetical protein
MLFSVAVLIEPRMSGSLAVDDFGVTKVGKDLSFVGVEGVEGRAPHHRGVKQAFDLLQEINDPEDAHVRPHIE